MAVLDRLPGVTYSLLTLAGETNLSKRDHLKETIMIGATTQTRMIAAEAAEVEADKYLAEAVKMSLLED